MSKIEHQEKSCDVVQGKAHSHTECCGDHANHEASSTDSHQNNPSPCTCHCSMAISVFSFEAEHQDLSIIYSFEFKKEAISMEETGYSKGFTSIWQPPKLA